MAVSRTEACASTACRDLLMCLRLKSCCWTAKTSHRQVRGKLPSSALLPQSAMQFSAPRVSVGERCRWSRKLLQRALVRRPGHAALADDCGHMLIRRDVERGVLDLDAVGRDLAVAQVRDLARRALLDGDGASIRTFQVHSGKRRS